MNGDRTPCGTSTTASIDLEPSALNRQLSFSSQKPSSFTLRGGFVIVAGTPAGTLPDRELGCLL